MTSPSYPAAVATSTTYDQGRKGNGHDASPELVARALGGAVRTGSGWDCRCPCHEDRTASLSVSVGDKRPLVVHCHAGCAQADVLAELKKRGLTPKRERTVKPRIVATYDYVDEHGVALFQVVRLDPKDFRQRLPDGTWKLGGVRRVLYRLPEVLAAGEVVLVEGEKDVESLRKLGLVATCNPGGAGKWAKRYAETLEGKRVIVIPDDDEPGEKHLRAVLATLPGARVLRLEGAKDVTAWLEAGHTPGELLALVRQAPAPEPAAEDWRDWLVMAGKTPAKVEANVLVALRRAPDLAGRVRLNLLANAVELRDMPWCRGTDWHAWSDTDSGNLAAWLQHRGLLVKPATCAVAVVIEAAGREHDPVGDYLGGLRWDGTPRLASWLAGYLGAHGAPDAYLAAVGRAWMVAMVARALRPGCKADHVLILEGPQGKLKSSALRALMPDETWFADDLATLGTKDAAQDLKGKWLIELSELSAMGRAEIEKVKAFFSRLVDHYRASYGRFSEDFPRRNGFAGTTNAETYLLDDANRRHWAVRIGRVDLVALVRDRDQLWAEAVAAFGAGEEWWLDEATEALAAVEQEARRQADPWEDLVREWLEDRIEDCTTQQVLAGAIRMPPDRQDRAAQTRIGRALKAAGWERHRSPRVDGGGRGWVYRRAGGASGAEVGPEKPSDPNAGPTGPTGPTNNDDYDALRARVDEHANLIGIPNPGGSSGAGPPPWTDWVAWRSRCARDPDAHKAWLAAAGGTVDKAGIARLPGGLGTGKARDWLESTLAEAGLEVRER